MKGSILILAIFILFQLSSCVSPINCRKQFTAYKEPFIEKRSNSLVRTNGVFVSANHRGAFALFSNGVAKFIDSNQPVGVDFWLNPDSNFYQIEKQIAKIGKEGTGHFRIQNDTIIIQTFGLANDQLCRRAVFEAQGVIINDSTIAIYSEFYRNNYEFLKESNIYRLYKTEQKPDSTMAWFNNKRWYKKNLHESRR